MKTTFSIYKLSNLYICHSETGEYQNSSCFSAPTDIDTLLTDINSIISGNTDDIQTSFDEPLDITYSLDNLQPILTFSLDIPETEDF